MSDKVFPKNILQINEASLDFETKRKISRYRVLSLRLNDYMSQSGRRSQNFEKDDKASLFSLAAILRKFAKDKKSEILEAGYISIDNYNIIVGTTQKSRKDFSNRISAIILYHTKSLQSDPVALQTEFCDFIEHFLNTKEEEFGINYKYNFYKDIYDLSDKSLEIDLKAGIYKLERLSSWHKGGKISVSKLEIIKCVDIKGKNVFNEPGRVRFRFVEEKWSKNKDKHQKIVRYHSLNKGRIVIRNKQNYIFLGIATHTCKGDKEKTIQVMSVVVKGNILEGVGIDTTGTNYIPFAARMRATFIAKDKTELKAIPEYKNDESFFNTRVLTKSSSDKFFTSNDSLVTGNGIISALFD